MKMNSIEVVLKNGEVITVSDDYITNFLRYRDLIKNRQGKRKRPIIENS